MTAPDGRPKAPLKRLLLAAGAGDAPTTLPKLTLCRFFPVVAPPLV